MYEWIFNKEGKVNKGLECVMCIDYDWYDSCFKDPCKIVRLAGYWPYYTDGTPDPEIDEVNECNYIEVDGDVSDSQVRLDNLFEIKWHKEPEQMLFNGEEVDCLGVTENDWGDSYTIIVVNDEKRVVDTEDLEVINHIWELTEEECAKLAKEIGRGSIYLSDYYNSLGVPANEASSYSDIYYEYLNDKYGDDYSNDKDTTEEFAYFLFNEC